MSSLKLGWPLVDEDLMAALRTKLPAERIRLLCSASHTFGLLAQAGVRYQHSNWNDAQVEFEVRRRLFNGTMQLLNAAQVLLTFPNG
jgi:hypothetical protein